MGKFNKKDEGVKPTIVNHMGEKAYKPNAEEELVATVMTTMLLKHEQVSLTILICLMLPLYALLYENLNRFFPLLIVRQLPFKVKPPCLNTKELNFSGDLNLDGRLANFLKKRL